MGRTKSEPTLLLVGGKPICPLNSYALVPSYTKKKYIPHPRKASLKNYAPSMTHFAMPRRIFTLSSVPHSPQPDKLTNLKAAETPPPLSIERVT